MAKALLGELSCPQTGLVSLPIQKYKGLFVTLMLAWSSHFKAYDKVYVMGEALSGELSSMWKGHVMDHVYK